MASGYSTTNVRFIPRYDMLFWNSYLATRSKAPTSEDFDEMFKLLKYLDTSGKWGVRFKKVVRAAIIVYFKGEEEMMLSGFVYS